MAFGILAIILGLSQAAGDAAGDTFLVFTFDGKTASGRLVSLSSDATLSLRGESVHNIPLSNVQSLRRPKPGLPGPPRGPYLLLANGDRVPAELTAADREQLQVATQGVLGKRVLTLPISSVRGFWRSPPVTQDNVERRHWAWEHNVPQHDQLLLKNDDSLEGTWDGLRDGRCLVRQGAKTQSVSLSTLAALAFHKAPNGSLPAKAAARVIFSDGTRLTVTEVRTTPDAANLQIATAMDLSATIPIAKVVSIEPISDRIIYLSDLTPLSEDLTPFLDIRWPMVRDGSAAKSWLRLDGQVFEKGLGMHATSELTCDLDGKYQAFEALVGLDDQAGRLGRARVQVLADGQQKYTSGELLGGQKPVAIRVEVAGGRRLLLRVLATRSGDVQAHVDWAEARLLRAPEK